MVLRIGGIYGPGRHRFLHSFTEGEENPSYLNLIYRDDLVTAIQACAQGIAGREPGLGGAYNVTDGSPVRKDEIAHYLNRLAERNAGLAPSRPSRGQANRRVSTELFRRTFHWTPEVGNYREGYQLLVREGSAD